MTTTVDSVKGGKVWENPQDAHPSRKTLNLTITGVAFTALTLGLSIYSVINLILIAPDYYKVTTTTDTFTNPPGIWTAPMWSALISLLCGIIAATLIWLAEGSKDATTLNFCLFVAAIISMVPFAATAGIVHAVNQNQVNTQFAHWLKTEHNLTIPENLPTEPTELASKPRLLKDTHGNPILVTFKTYDNLVVFDNATRK